MILNNFMNYAHIIKLAKEEAILFFKNENPLEISEIMLNRPNVVITNGANPISWFINGFQGTNEVINSY